MLFAPFHATARLLLAMAILAGGLPVHAADPEKRSGDWQVEFADPCLGFDMKQARPRSKWPLELRELVDRLADPPTCLEVRFADPKTDNAYADNGFYWRMRADKAIVAAHAKQFGLKSTTADDKLTKKIFACYPPDWPKLEQAAVDWYVWPYNRDDEPIRAHFWQIMAYDQRNEILYFYYWIWDVGI